MSLATYMKSLQNWVWYDFTSTNLDKVPQTPGVYCLGNKNGIIYIGSSKDLRDRLMDHYYSNDPCIQKARQFAIEPCANYVQEERSRLRRYLIKHGRLPDCNDVIP